MFPIDSISQILAEQWLKLYKEKPIYTVVSTILVAAILAGLLSHLSRVEREKYEAERLKNLSYSEQITQLNEMEENINDLIEFVDLQRENLKDAEDTITALESEKSELEPIVKSNRDVVDAIFRYQDDRDRANIWRERWIGFGFGVLASLVASVIILVTKSLVELWLEQRQS